MSQPEFIPSSAPHKIEVHEGSHDAKIRSAQLGTETRQLAIDSDEVANAIDAEKRRATSFGPETDPPQQTSAEAEAAPDPLAQVEAAQSPEPVQEQAFAEPELEPELEPEPEPEPEPELEPDAPALVQAQLVQEAVAEPPIAPPINMSDDPEIAGRLHALEAQNLALRARLGTLESQSSGRA
ncbi:hypothetical protein LBMAG30_20240 [Comamonadaceae bacterium]|nr:hypothetical protein LBMAG30_20240 [Comamonadaceae bacterium]